MVGGDGGTVALKRGPKEIEVRHTPIVADHCVVGCRRRGLELRPPGRQRRRNSGTFSVMDLWPPSALSPMMSGTAAIAVMRMICWRQQTAPVTVL